MYSDAKAEIRQRSYQKNAVKVWERSLKRSYGIDLAEYNRLFALQNGLCAGCYKHQTQFKRRLDVDHNHKTGKVRGLLCTNCNRAIGHAHESVETLRRLVTYLERFK